MKTSGTNRKLRVILSALSDCILDPQPDFQRRLVWLNKDKVSFIRTVLDGLPFPEIYIAAGTVDPDTGRGTELLVDGQQRMTTLHQYFLGSEDLKLSEDVSPYHELSRDRKIAFLEYEVVVRDLGQLPIEDVRAIFLRINSTSYGLNAMEAHNARYAGAFKDFCETLSKWKFFQLHSTFSASDVRRMEDVKFCAVLVATILSGYFDRSRDLERFLGEYGESFPESERLHNLLMKGVSLINILKFEGSNRLYKKSDLFSFLVEYAKLTEEQRDRINASELEMLLEELFSKVHELRLDRTNADPTAYRYYRASLQGTNNRSNRIIRGQIMYDILCQSIDGMCFLERFVTLSPERQKEAIQEKVEASIHYILDENEVVSVMSSTNTSGWEVSDYNINDFEVQANGVNISISFTVVGEQNDDQAWAGNSVTGTASAFINARGDFQFEEIEAEKEELYFDLDNESSFEVLDNNRDMNTPETES